MGKQPTLPIYTCQGEIVNCLSGFTPLTFSLPFSTGFIRGKDGANLRLRRNNRRNKPAGHGVHLPADWRATPQLCERFFTLSASAKVTKRRSLANNAKKTLIMKFINSLSKCGIPHSAGQLMRGYRSGRLSHRQAARISAAPVSRNRKCRVPPVLTSSLRRLELPSRRSQ